MAALLSSEINAGENKSLVNITTTGGSECLLADVVGVRFKPTDEILAGHYLAGKVSDRTDGPIFPLIKSVDVYQYEPWQLTRRPHDFGDGIMYFFSPVKMKFDKGTNVNRVAGDGFWRKTGNSSDIKGEDGTTIATKTPLAYYKNGQKPNELPMKTPWLMKEFVLEKQSDENSNTQLALCVVYLHDRKRKQCESDENVSCDDVVKGSSESSAENLVMPSAPDQNPDFPRKRRCSSFGVDEMLSDQNPISFNDLNQGKASCSNAQSDIGSDDSVDQFMNDLLADPISNYDQSPLPDLGNCLPNSGDSLDQFMNDLLEDPIPNYDQSSSDFGNLPPNSDDKFLNDLLADPIPNYDQSPLSDFGNLLPNSDDKFLNDLLADPIPNYDQSPLSDFGNCLPNSDDSQE